MRRQKILSVIGTRPEAIKMVPVIKALAARSHFESYVCVTGQHRGMLDQVLDLFKVQPDFDLDLMKSGQGLTYVTCSVLKGLEDVLQRLRPDRMIVQGDTTTSFASSLAAFYHSVPVAHLEAGLRTGNPLSPWPEEMNRKLTTGIADLHLAPTSWARDNLLREGVAASAIEVTGNTVIDALLEVKRSIELQADRRQMLDREFAFLDPQKKTVLVTGHRRESFGGGFDRICRGLLRVAAITDVQIVYPVHLNPNVREPVQKLLGGIGNIHLVEPVDYLRFVYLMMRAHVILTDSGGVQEEAPSLGKPVLVMRDTTERPEAVEAGTSVLVGTDPKRIESEVLALCRDGSRYAAMARSRNVYGDGAAAERVVKAIEKRAVRLVSAAPAGPATAAVTVNEVASND